MKKLLTFFVLPALLFNLSGCADYYRDENLPPSEQEIQDARRLQPSGALQEGVFHMQRVQDGSAVLVKDKITLKRPELPPFDVAYINRDLESVVLELASAAGESIIMPPGLRGRTVTLVHSGADFQQMLELVLSKAGYHYNYANSVWYITRYPIRNYLLELGQSERSGSIVANAEVQTEGNTDASGAGSELDTSYSDALWDQVEKTLAELVEVGATKLPARSSGGRGNNAAEDSLIEQEATLLSDDIEDEGLEEIMGTLTDSGNVRPLNITPPTGTDHFVPEEDVSPWFRVSKGVGMITVRAAPAAHRMIEDYLNQVQESAHRQILVEARIVAVIKDSTTERGTDFDRTNLELGESILSAIGFQAARPITDTTKTGGFLTLSNSDNSINFIMQALSKLGDVYTISSPTLLARNNQISRVSITRQLGYAETEVEQNTNASGQIVIGSRVDTAKFKNSGTVLSVFPYIGKNKVQLRMRLSVASQVGTTTVSTSIGTNDPITNEVPELSNNVIDQDMILEFGRVYAIGGLIETSTDFQHSYIPGLSQIPGLAEIFQRATSQKVDTEFIVLLKLSRA